MKRLPKIGTLMKRIGVEPLQLAIVVRTYKDRGLGMYSFADNLKHYHCLSFDFYWEVVKGKR
jgi:hypothetical protein